jgi:hypothetical protein
MGAGIEEGYSGRKTPDTHKDVAMGLKPAIGEKNKNVTRHL